MYTQSIRQGMRVSHLFMFLAVVVFLVGPLSAFASAEAEELSARIAAVGPKAISGYVYAGGGSTPAVGATVVATVWDGLTYRATLSTSSDGAGFYTMTFAPEDWDVGNVIVVVATLGSNVGEGTAIADDLPTQTVNIVLGGVVPEFGTPAVAILSGVTAIVVLVGRRRAR